MNGRWRRDLGFSLAALLVVDFLYQPLNTFKFAPGDFAAFAGAARILLAGHGAHLYSPLAQLAAASAYSGAHVLPNSDYLLNPPLCAWLLTPLVRLPFDAALGIFTALGVLCVLAAVWLLHRHVLPAPLLSLPTLVVVASTLSLATGWNILMGNWDAFILLAVVAGAVLLRGRPVLAGLLLAVLCVKPQMGWMVPVALLIARQWRVLGGMLLGGLLWLGTSLLIVGPAGLVAWFHLDSSMGASQLTKAVGLPGLLALAGLPATAVDIVIGVGTLAAIALLWRLREPLRRDPAVAVGLAVIASLLLAPHVNLQDTSLLALPLCLWGRQHPRNALAGALCLSACAFPYVNVLGVAQDSHLMLLALLLIGVGVTLDVDGQQTSSLTTGPAASGTPAPA